MRKRMNVMNALLAVICTAALTLTACGGSKEAAQTDTAQATESGETAQENVQADAAEAEESADPAEGTESAGAAGEDAASEAEAADNTQEDTSQEAEEAAAESEAAPEAQAEEGADTASETESGEAVESPAPAYYEVLSSFTAEDLDGNTVTEEIFAGSKLTMVNVWGTFCGPCIREMPYLGTIAESYDPSEFQIVGLVSDVIGWDGQVDADVASTAKDIIAQTGADYLHVAPTGELMNLLYELQYVPTTVFVDSEGNAVSEEYVGSYSEEDWKAIIEEILAR